VPGAKSSDAVEWGTLVVSMVSSGALTALIKTADSWLARQRHGISLRVGEDELVLTGSSTAHQQRVIEQWLSARASGNA